MKKYLKELAYEWKYQHDRYNHLCFWYNFVLSAFVYLLWVILFIIIGKNIFLFLFPILYSLFGPSSLIASYGGGSGRIAGEWLIKKFRTKRQQDILDVFAKRRTHAYQLREKEKALEEFYRREKTIIPPKKAISSKEEDNTSKEERSNRINIYEPTDIIRSFYDGRMHDFRD